MRRRLAVGLEYDGGAYCGWQQQSAAASVQAALEQALNCTPFPYVLFFPVSVYLGQVHGADLWRGLGLQAAWLVFFYLLARAVWRRGIRKYSAAGG